MNPSPLIWRQFSRARIRLQFYVFRPLEMGGNKRRQVTRLDYMICTLCLHLSRPMAWLKRHYGCGRVRVFFRMVGTFLGSRASMLFCPYPQSSAVSLRPFHRCRFSVPSRSPCLTGSRNLWERGTIGIWYSQLYSFSCITATLNWDSTNPALGLDIQM
jgi:hypothetical protein